MTRSPGRLARRWLVALAAALAAPLPAVLQAQGPSRSLTFPGDGYLVVGHLRLLTNGARPRSPLSTTRRLVEVRVWGDHPDARPGQPVAPTDLTALHARVAGGNRPDDAGAASAGRGRTAAPQLAAERVVARAGQHAGAGARSVLPFSFLILGVTPGAGTVSGRSAAPAELAGVFDGTLAARVPRPQGAQPFATFYHLRLDNLFANVLADAVVGGARHGLTKFTVPCLAVFALAGAPSCDASVWADALRPTTRYVLTGQHLVAELEPAVVIPVGGGLVLLGRREPAAVLAPRP